MTTLSEKQFSSITKRFVANGIKRKEMSIPYLINNQIMATDAHTAVLINVDKLDYAYVSTDEDATTKDKMERLISYLFNGFDASTSLTISKKTIQDTIRFLKGVKKNHRTFKTDISFNDGSLSFTCYYHDDEYEFTEVVYTIEQKDIKIPLHRDKKVAVAVNPDFLINTLITMRDTDNKSTLNFTGDSKKPILFSNSTLQIIIAPIRP